MAHSSHPCNLPLQFRIGNKWVDEWVYLNVVEVWADYALPGPTHVAVASFVGPPQGHRKLG